MGLRTNDKRQLIIVPMNIILTIIINTAVTSEVC